MDSELEYALRKAVLLIQKNSLTIIVAHRLETLIQADKLLLIDEGRLVAQGRHDELLATNTLYGDFVEEIRARRGIVNQVQSEIE